VTDKCVTKSVKLSLNVYNPWVKTGGGWTPHEV
jgi:hypothetical protein